MAETRNRYKIISAVSGKVLDVQGDSRDDHALIQQYPDTAQDNQRWSLRSLGDGTFKIISTVSGANGKLLSIFSPLAGTPIELQPDQGETYTGPLTQRWKIVPSGIGNLVSIVEPQTGLALSATVPETTVPNRFPLALASNDITALEWQIVGLDGQRAFKLLAVGTAYPGYGTTYFPVSGLVLDLPDGSPQTGAKLQLYPDNAGSNQKWELLPHSRGNVKIRSVASGKVLDVIDASHENGVQIQQYADHDGHNQIWHLIPAGSGSGFVKFRSLASGKVLEVPSNALQDNVVIQQNEDTGGLNQHWQLLYVAGG